VENSRRVVSAFYHNTGSVLSNINYRNEYELFFVEDGEIELTVGEHTYTAAKNSLTLLANLEQQTLRLKKDTHCSRFCLFLNAPLTDAYIRNPELLDLLKNHPDGFCHCVDMSDCRDEVMGLILKMGDCIEGKDYDNDLAGACLTQLLVLVSRLQPAYQRGGISRAYKNRMYVVQRYIDEHFCEDITVSEIAKRNYVSVCYLSHSFKALTGYSPKKYLTLVRLKNASMMLCDTALSVGEIAERCGFSDLNNFCKQFKTHYGCTPGSLRAGKG